VIRPVKAGLKWAKFEQLERALAASAAERPRFTKYPINNGPFLFLLDLKFN
jgi:hypothetical protein